MVPESSQKATEKLLELKRNHTRYHQGAYLHSFTTSPSNCSALTAEREPRLVFHQENDADKQEMF